MLAFDQTAPYDDDKPDFSANLPGATNTKHARKKILIGSPHNSGGPPQTYRARAIGGVSKKASVYTISDITRMTTPAPTDERLEQLRRAIHAEARQTCASSDAVLAQFDGRARAGSASWGQVPAATPGPEVWPRALVRIPGTTPARSRQPARPCRRRGRGRTPGAHPV